MKCNWISRCLVGLAAVGIVVPAVPAQAAGPARPQQRGSVQSVTPTADAQPAVTVQDVALRSGGILAGQVVTAQGAGIAATNVSIRQNGVEIGQSSTDRDGAFAISGLRGGVYQVVAGNAAGNFRLWTENTAPPAAQSAAMIVDQQDAVRGQTPLGKVATSNAVIIGGVALAALSIPFIVHAARDKKSGS